MTVLALVLIVVGVFVTLGATWPVNAAAWVVLCVGCVIARRTWTRRWAA
jgi:predicted histidine transporter YuiF (NhaC family)